MGLPSAPIIPKDGVLKVEDATATPIVFTCQFEDGDEKFTGLAKDQKNVTAYKDRGEVYSLREDEDIEAVEIEWSVHLIGLTDAAIATLFDALLKRGPVWASATNQLAAAYGGGTTGTWCVKLTWTAERSDFGGTADTSLAFKYFHADSVDIGISNPGKLTIKGRAFRMQHDVANWMTVA